MWYWWMLERSGRPALSQYTRFTYLSAIKLRRHRAPVRIRCTVQVNKYKEEQGSFSMATKSTEKIVFKYFLKFYSYNFCSVLLWRRICTVIKQKSKHVIKRTQNYYSQKGTQQINSSSPQCYPVHICDQEVVRNVYRTGTSRLHSVWQVRFVCGVGVCVHSQPSGPRKEGEMQTKGIAMTNLTLISCTKVILLSWNISRRC